MKIKIDVVNFKNNTESNLCEDLGNVQFYILLYSLAQEDLVNQIVNDIDEP